jgi:hypothetical protein
MFFEFERDFVASLRCIPMIVRYRLDTCGVKLKLNHWNNFSLSQRQALINLPFDTPEDIAKYRELLQSLVIAQTGSPPSRLEVSFDWLNADQIPPPVSSHMEQQLGYIPLTLETWRNLTPLQRFALIKLSQPSHENHNFLPALRELGILDQKSTKQE